MPHRLPFSFQLSALSLLVTASLVTPSCTRPESSSPVAEPREDLSEAPRAESAEEPAVEAPDDTGDAESMAAPSSGVPSDKGGRAESLRAFEARLAEPSEAPAPAAEGLPMRERAAEAPAPSASAAPEMRGGSAAPSESAPSYGAGARAPHTTHDAPAARAKASAAPSAAPSRGRAPGGAGSVARPYAEDDSMDAGVSRERIRSTPPVRPQRSPGVLTAGTWDDNLNFDFFSVYRNTLYASQLDGLLPISLGAHSAARADASQATPKRRLDLSFVIDTTGSMGDEISYIQREFRGLSRRIAERYPNAGQRWSLVAYRDEGDEYVVRSYDFGTDVDDFVRRLEQLQAGGGGDYPEAPDRALAEAAELDWRDSNATARLLFWVADAPHHAENASRMARSIRRAQDRDLHIYPVASSGVDELTELTMRSAAQLTGGRYIFLTDDSGVGGAHKEPTLPCYFVTMLKDAILRMVDVELSGAYREPTARETVRETGDPQSRVCQLSGGRRAQAY